MTVMGDARREGLSDRGSIPLRSTEKELLMLEYWTSSFKAVLFCTCNIPLWGI